MARALGPLLVVIALLASGCAESEQITLTPTSRTQGPGAATSAPAPPSIPAATPSATLPPSPSPGTTGAPTSRLNWTKVGELDLGRGEFAGLARIEGGYLAWGSVYPKGVDPDDADPLPATWVSSDLRTWQRKVHAKLIVPCEGWSARSDLGAVSGASDGTTFVFVAGQQVPDPATDGGCDRTEIVSLATRDGITWTRSAPFRPTDPDTDQHVYPIGPWRIPGSWELQVPAGETKRTVWQSDDLFEWHEVGSIPVFDNGGWGALAVADDGTRLGYGSIGDTGSQALLTSSDGVTWRTARRVAESDWVPWALPPAAGDDRWVIPLVDGSGKAKLLFSSDLESFVRLTFPRAALDRIVRTPHGWVAVGFTPMMDTGCQGDCFPTPDEALYTSRDGQKWSKRPNALTDRGRWPTLVSDGDSVLGVVARGGVVRMWRLDPPY